MKKAFALLVLALAVADNALAVVDPDPNKLGFYFDQAADVCNVNTFDFLSAYLIVTNPSFDVIKGLECYLDWDESACMFLGLLLPDGGMNIGNHHNVIMGVGAPLPTTEATVMATYNLLPTGVALFTLAAAQPPSISGNLPVVVDGDDNMFQIGVSGGSGNVCAAVNGGSGESQSQTWGGVKSLYR